MEGNANSREFVKTLRRKIYELPPVRRENVKRKPSIWRVPPHLRNLDPEAYEPKMVSIGPLHRGNKRFLEMEELKLENFRYILSLQTGNPLDIYFQEVFDSVGEARNEYSEKSNLSNDEFAEMLIIDGCFIVGLLLECDPIIKTPIIAQVKGVDRLLWEDLMLLENQIPFCVVNKLYSMIAGMLLPPGKLSAYPDFASAFLKKFLRQQYPSTLNVKKVKHILHLFHRSFDPSSVPDEPNRQSYGQKAIFLVKKLTGLFSIIFFGLVYLLLFRDFSSLFGRAEILPIPRRIPCATELIEAGIKFKKKATSQIYGRASELKVSFSDGRLEIPWLLVEDSKRTELSNLIAFEQCCKHYTSHFSAYCIFMDYLIDTASDIAILQRSGILENTLCSNSEAAKMFNALSKEVLWDTQDHYLADVYKEVTKFCQAPHHKWRANLLETYFRNPWTILSLIAALLLLAFTGTQTFFTVFPRRSEAKA